jgi:Flp pilus assembly protein protease CpaA
VATHQQETLIAATWGVCFALWSFRAFGGGDMKLAMALIGLFPNERMLITLLSVVLFGLIVVLLRRDGHVSLRRLWVLFFTALNGTLPTRHEVATAYKTRPSRVTFVISLAGVTYIWFFM